LISLSRIERAQCRRRYRRRGLQTARRLELIDIALDILSCDDPAARARVSIGDVLRGTRMDEKTPKASKVELPLPEATQLALFHPDVHFVYANGFLLNLNVSDGEMVIAIGVKHPGTKLADETTKAGSINFSHRIHLPLQVGMQIRDALNQAVATLEKMHKLTTESSTTKN
jgi:hypothetical protein